MTDTEVRTHAAEMLAQQPSEHWKVRRPAKGPPVLEGPFWHPVSLLDLTLYSATGKLPDARVVPLERDYKNYPRCSPLVLVSPESLHSEVDHPKPVWDMATATAIRYAYWDGSLGMRELARQYCVDVKLVYRLVHSLTCWYAW